MMNRPLPRTREAVDWWLKEWGRDEVLSGDDPLTRADVERLLDVNGGAAEGLDLSLRNFRSANLANINLRGVVLREADLGRVDLRDAELFRADLTGADLFRTDLRGAFLAQANLEGAFILAVRIDDQTNLDDINWGHKRIDGWEQIKFYQNARANYRMLNTWYQHHGQNDVAGDFLYREWVCKRLESWEDLTNGLSWRPWSFLKAITWGRWLSLVTFLWLLVHELMFGYGERPVRVVLAAIVVVMGFALVYFVYPFSELSVIRGTEFLDRAWQSYYFSLVSFTTLGYGEWVKHPDNWLRYVGGLESFIGLFLTALFLVTFNRKWTK